MDPVIIGVIGFIGLLVLVGLGIPIGVALLATGLVGVIALKGLEAGLGLLSSSMYAFSSIYVFCALPLFLLMGSFAFRGGFAEGMYQALYNWLQRLPGSLAIATTVGSGAFGAVSGSSTATVAIFGKVSLPAMTKHNYQKGLSLGCIAASGTFATMIPPSGLLILYGIFTDISIAKLFMAGLLPGLTTVLAYSAMIIVRVWRNPQLAPAVIEEAVPWKEKIASLRLTWPISALAIIVLGGIYSGVLTITEAASFGAIAAGIIAVQQRGIRNVGVRGALRETAYMTAMIFLIIIGAFFFARFVALSRLPANMATLLQGSAAPNVVILGGILVMYFFLGMFVTASGLIAITIPMVLPIILSMGYDPVWFGIMVIKLCEIGFVTPPVGINAYVLKGAVGEQASLADVFTGIWPFVIADAVVVVLLIAFPQIALFLPNAML